MISNLFLKTLSWRISLMKYSNCTFLAWDKKRNRLVLTKNKYKLFCSYQLLIYMACFGFITIYFIADFMFTKYENGNQDVYDVGYKPRDKAYAALIHAVHAMYIGAFVLIGGCFSRFIEKRKEFVNFFNMSLEAATRYQEKYEAHLARYTKAKRVSQMSDAIVIGIALATVIVPFFYGGLIFQRVLPENRIIVEILEIPLKFSWKLVPLSIPLAYAVINATDFVFIFDIGATIYFQCCVYWSHLLQPVSLKFEKGKAKFTCRLGCVLDADELIRFYDEQKEMERCFNDIYAHWKITLHHIALSTLGLFICIQHTDRLLEPGFQMTPLAVILSSVLEYMETMFVVDAHQRSEMFLCSWETLARRERKCLKIVQKYLQAFRPIQAQLAYPVFAVSKENFLEYQGQIADFLVDVLVST